MMQNEEGSVESKMNAELSRAVYDVGSLFCEVQTRGYVVCRKDVVNIKPGNLVVYQENGDVHVSVAVLVVAVVESIIVSPMSAKVFVFCDLYKLSDNKDCFEPSGVKRFKIPYEYFRVKLLNVDFDERKRVFLEGFGGFPSLKYFR